MRPRHSLLTLSLITAASAHAAEQDKAADAKPAQAPAAVAGPMASFARLVPGEWRQTAQSGTSMYHTWHWGPGQHSVRRMTDGAGADGKPWRELQVFYWHPGRKQVRLAGFSPYAGGVSEGTMTFDRDTANAVLDLYQTGRRRKMGLRWSFDGPDKYRDTLLEDTGAGLMPLVEFEQVRVRTPATPRKLTPDELSKPPERLKALDPLLGYTWQAKGEWAAGGAAHVESSFGRVPLADVIYVRVLAPTIGGKPTHLLDAYLYHHTGANTLRCLALSNRGGVYEGEVTALDGALQLGLKGYEGDRSVSRLVRLDFEKDGTPLQRVWSLSGADRTLVLDVRHNKLVPKKN
jgi:hypothetical protein